MKWYLQVDAGDQRSAHTLELYPAANQGTCSGPMQFRLDNASGEMPSADWAEVAAGTYSIILGGRSYEARVVPAGATGISRETAYVVSVDGREYGVRVCDPRSRRRQATASAREGPQEILAPMPGRIVRVLAAEGQQVEAGHGMLIIEAMKMQNELKAPRAGRIEKIYVGEGTGVETGTKLVRLA